jgi:hypothetical protein
MIPEEIKKLAKCSTLIGLGMVLEHRLKYGKWYDRDKKACHGKAGLILGGIGLACLLFS